MADHIRRTVGAHERGIASPTAREVSNLSSRSSRTRVIRNHQFQPIPNTSTMCTKAESRTGHSRGRRCPLVQPIVGTRVPRSSPDDTNNYIVVDLASSAALPTLEAFPIASLAFFVVLPTIAS